MTPPSTSSTASSSPATSTASACASTAGSPNGNGLQVLGPVGAAEHDRAARCALLHREPVQSERHQPGARADRATTGGSAGGSAALPYRPSPLYQASLARTRTGRATRRAASSSRTRRSRSGSASTPSIPSTRTSAKRELMWNRGASQDEKEFKEGYLDIELLDSRLWIRGGKQNIVWGKTELFRTTDQFNPVDLALATLPSLEESRIALWALRGVYSFYDVGPLEDVRLEVRHEPRPDGAHRPRPLRRALHAAAGLRQVGGTLLARHRGFGAGRRRAAAELLGRRVGPRVRRASRVPLGSLLLRGLGLLGLRRLPLRRADLPLRTQRRSGDRPPAPRPVRPEAASPAAEPACLRVSRRTTRCCTTTPTSSASR